MALSVNGTTEADDAGSSRWPDDDVILYDGVCIFCSRWIRFVAARDERRFRFTPIQSDYGTRLAQAFGIDPADPDTNAVIDGGVAWFRSDAALTVLSGLAGWRWTQVLFAVPKPLRDAIYNVIAKAATGFSERPTCVLYRMGDAGESDGVRWLTALKAIHRKLVSRRLTDGAYSAILAINNDQKFGP